MTDQLACPDWIDVDTYALAETYKFKEFTVTDQPAEQNEPTLPCPVCNCPVFESTEYRGLASRSCGDSNTLGCGFSSTTSNWDSLSRMRQDVEELKKDVAYRMKCYGEVMDDFIGLESKYDELKAILVNEHNALVKFRNREIADVAGMMEKRAAKARELAGVRDGE